MTIYPMDDEDALPAGGRTRPAGALPGGFLVAGDKATGNTRAKAMPAELPTVPAYAELTSWAPELVQDAPMGDALAGEAIGRAAQAARLAIDATVAGIAGRLTEITANLRALESRY